MATWTVVSNASVVSYASHARWRDQYRPSRGASPSDLRLPFRGLTMADRDEEPPATYTPEEEAALCVVCHVPLICETTHNSGALHAERVRAKKDAAAAAAAVAENIEAALELIRRERPELLTRTTQPSAAGVPTSCPTGDPRPTDPVQQGPQIPPEPTMPLPPTSGNESDGLSDTDPGEATRTPWPLLQMDMDVDAFLAASGSED